MASALYRLGGGAFRHRRLVLGAWLAVLAIVIGSLAAFGGKLDDKFTIPGSESQQALDRMGSEFPGAAGTSAQILFSAPAGAKVSDPRYAAAIEKSLGEARKAPQVAAVVDPFKAGTVSPGGKTALAQIQYPVDRTELDKGSLGALAQTVRPAEQAGMEVAVGGGAYAGTGVSVGAREAIGVLVALVVLTITFGSLLLAGMPLLSAFVGIAVGIAGLLTMTGVVRVSSTAVTLALMLGIAVGIDYALFILSRHRGQLAQGMNARESAARATATAGSAVVFAGTTVIIALLGLSVVRIPFLTVMGLGAAATVLVAVLVAITLLPAIAGFAGRRLTPKPGSRAARRAAPEGRHHDPIPTVGERWARLATRKPLITLLAVVAALVTVAVPSTDLRLALPDNGSAAKGSSERVTYDRISKTFGQGFNGPLLILADTGGGNGGQREAARVAGELHMQPGVVAVSRPLYNRKTGSALIQLVPTSAPDAEATKRLVDEIRARAPTIKSVTGAAISVTGTTAVNIDVSNRLSASQLPFGAVVVGLSLLLLLLVFRSLVIPVKAAAGFLLSLAASLGAAVAVFQWGWLADLIDVARTGPVPSFLPIILIAVLFGLAMDYEVFLVSSMGEEWARTHRAQPSILLGTRHAARVVTAAALIMFSVFASFVAIQDAIIKPIAFSLAFGVLVDAFLIRMTFVPAVLALVGRSAWWLPRWLGRLLPNLDIEGERLPAAPPTATASDAASPGQAGAERDAA